MSKKATIQDIARLADVSPATVSRVLNGTARVDPEKQKRVMQVINEQNFVPSLNATGLKGRSQLIGVLMPRLVWTALLEMLWVVSNCINRDRRYQIVLYSYEDDNLCEMLEQIQETEHIAGLLLSLPNASPEMVEQLSKLQVPAVVIDPIGVAVDLPRVCADHYQGAYEAVRHLILLGHTRIGYIQGEDAPCSWDRYRGYCDALQEAGIERDPMLFFQGLYRREYGVAGTALFMKIPSPPTAIFAGDDSIAHGVLDGAKMFNLRVPQDLAVIGFNDDPQFHSGNYSDLSTVRQPFADMSLLATEWLLSMLMPYYELSAQYWELMGQARLSVPLDEIKEGTMPQAIQLPTRLIVRRTCGGLPADPDGH